MFALGGVLAGWGVNHGGPVVAVALPLGVGLVFGAVQGLLIARARLAPFIVTLAGLLFARGLLQAMTNEGSRPTWYRHTRRSSRSVTARGVRY